MRASGPLNPEWEVSPEEVARLRRAGARLFLIDCRTEKEHALARIEGAVLIPLGELGSRAQDLAADIDEDHEVVVFCHHGVRSLKAAALLRAAGVERAMSMAGGIDAWSKRVDAGVPVY